MNWPLLVLLFFTVVTASIHIYPCTVSSTDLIDEYRVISVVKPSVEELDAPRNHVNLSFKYDITANSHHYKLIRPWRFEVTFQNHVLKTFTQSSLNWTEIRTGVLQSEGHSIVYENMGHFDKVRAELTTVATYDSPSLILECWHWLNR